MPGWAEGISLLRKLIPLLVIIVHQRQLCWPRYRSTPSTHLAGLIRLMEDEAGLIELSKALNNMRRWCTFSLCSFSNCYFSLGGASFFQIRASVSLSRDIGEWLTFSTMSNIYLHGYTTFAWQYCLLNLASQNVVWDPAELTAWAS